MLNLLGTSSQLVGLAGLVALAAGTSSDDAGFAVKKARSANQPVSRPIKASKKGAWGDTAPCPHVDGPQKFLLSSDTSDSEETSPSAAHTNDETLLIIESPQLAKHFTREMDRLWDTAELGITPHLQRKLDRQRIRCGGGVKRR